ncbi:MAG: DUF6057 family protein [Tannerellaceae bacterium]|jgi:hypothetical protein|nr:DUF6057 family protein [Tannerellaceae bacterium]
MKHFLTFTAPLVIFLLGSFLFFFLDYRYWYMFMEQYTIFLYTGEYLCGLLGQAGGMNEYLSAFVMQCFHLPFAAPLCLTALLWLMTAALFSAAGSVLAGRPLVRLLCFLPAFMFCLFPVESVAPIMATVTGLWAAAGYSSVKDARTRVALGLALVTALYPLAAPAHMIAAAAMMAHECGRAGRKMFLAASGLLAWAALLPLIAMRTVYVVSMREAFIGKHIFHPEYPLPPSFWYLSFSLIVVWVVMVAVRRRDRPLAVGRVRRYIAPSVMLTAYSLVVIYGGHPLEQAYMYDHLARGERWGDIAAHASLHPVKDKDALIYANLAYLHTGAFNNNLMRLPQIGEEGLMPYDPKTRLGLIEAAEVSWALNHTNAAQRFAFVGVLSSERGAQPRLMRRLIETYIVNEEYKAAAKYIGILEKTAFYKSPMKKYRPLLHPEGSGSQTPTPTGSVTLMEWVEKRRRLNPVTDNHYDPAKALPQAIAALLNDHPDNAAAFTYGMGYLLMYKGLVDFMAYMEKVKGEKLPVVYQEAICVYYTAVVNNPEAIRAYAVEPAVYNRFLTYMQQVSRISPALLARQYGDTYYYYAQFIQPPENTRR